MTRPYRLNLTEFQRLRIRLRTGEGVRTVLLAEVDGAEQRVVDCVVDSNEEVELAGPISGERLSKLTLVFSLGGETSVLTQEHARDAAGGTQGILLRWIMLEKDGPAWTPPVEPFAGMIEQGRIERTEPGLGLLFGIEGLTRLREFAETPAFAEVWQADLRYAERESAIDPTSLIRPYTLYVPSRYGRVRDDAYETSHDGIILALVGLLTGREDFLRQAARHAVALARCDHWAEGFVDRMPGHAWYHSGFAPNVATIRASLLLDWTWHALTAEGRDLVRDAIATKGLPIIERGKDAMANQGIRFSKGLILGKMALAESFDDPELQTYVRACVERINNKLDDIVRPDGTFSEGMNNYGKGTMASTPISYHAAARCLGVPIADLVSRRMLPSMRYILTADGRLNAPMAAFCAGPLRDEAFAGQCLPTGLLHNFLDSDIPTGKHEGNRIEYVFFGLASLWAPKLHDERQSPSIEPFSVFRDGGWVFLGNNDSAAPRLSFESGLWDGHGHAWYHKHAVTLDAWGERLLITRHHLGYQDARSRYTMSTRLYNTFAPGGRDQDASGAAGRGGRLYVAEDFGSVAAVESDNATAWKEGVARAVRRLLFLRPNVVIIIDDAELSAPEPGVQSWNSFQPWRHVDEHTCESCVGDAAVRLTAITSDPMTLTSGEDSVSREGNLEVPMEVAVHRAAFETAPSMRHHILTVIETIPPEGSGEAATVEITHERRPVVEITQGKVVTRIAAAPVADDQLWGCTTDGEAAFAVQEDNGLTVAGAFAAHRLDTRLGCKVGDGFLSLCL